MLVRNQWLVSPTLRGRDYTVMKMGPCQGLVCPPHKPRFEKFHESQGSPTASPTLCLWIEAPPKHSFSVCPLFLSFYFPVLFRHKLVKFYYAFRPFIDFLTALFFSVFSLEVIISIFICMVYSDVILCDFVYSKTTSCCYKSTCLPCYLQVMPHI